MAKRRPIKTVMQELMLKAARIIRHARRWVLSLGERDRGFAVFERHYRQLSGQLRGAQLRATKTAENSALIWIGLVSCIVALALLYAYVSFARLEIFKMSMAVLGAIVFGLATPTEAAAMGSMGGLVCGQFVGSSIF
jgi:uncharacterized membrane protein